ncbi:UvrD-helicase domain-containing protein, partial [Candidatus Pacearchaeota archaeon]|nr:UvrD-helicase domain-containing protein [Candidatus Pacearchaeota archaeon]
GIKEIPFGVGKNLLIDFLVGDSKNKSIKNNKLQGCDNFGILDKSKKDVKGLVENLIENKLIELVSVENNRFLKVLKLTKNGILEISDPKLFKKKLKNNFVINETVINDNDRILFKELDSFLHRFNDNQKKGIISDSEKILCIAGAGSGKTSVLTKRIEFLVKYRGVDSNKILAITFTRKAKQEMKSRLTKLGVSCYVETFNSFCEKILKKHGSLIYGRPVRVITYANKVMAISQALSSINTTMDQACDKYFSEAQKRSKEKQKLYNIFMNDCFFILDYFKSKNQELTDFSLESDYKHQESARMIYSVCKYLQEHMKLTGLRDFTDQMLDTVKYFKENSSAIPEFNHILVDEYQDVNKSQIELIELLDSKNLFVVGDPRQSIFGWRGSDINFILNFGSEKDNCEIITLTKNYRSNNHIVKLMNTSIKDMNLPDVTHNIEGEKNIKLLDFENEGLEHDFVINGIINSKFSGNDIFVLARTNRQINEISGLMKKKNIKHVLKTDENNNSIEPGKGDVVLATIHAIKGLEAKQVFLIGANEQNFPCKAQDHPVIEMIKIDEYDREEEEKRLFYVAISRAKQELNISYSGKKPTYFINDDMEEIIKG